jgi:preprotein translocase subunit YajC
MAIIVAGRLMTFIYMVIFFALMYYFMMINKEEKYTIRAMPAMQAIPEAIGRAAEMGRPVLWTPGISGALNNSSQGPQILAAISILDMLQRSVLRQVCTFTQLYHCPMHCP